MGITDLKLVATAFEAKWIWLQRTDHERAWGALPLKQSKEAAAFFRASTYSIVGNGQNTLFWKDSWINGVSITSMAPTLLQYVSSRTINRQTVAQALENRSWVRMIAGGVSMEAVSEYLTVWRAIRSFTLSDQPDRLVWRLASDGNFSVRSAYRGLHAEPQAVPGCVRVWGVWAPLRTKFFLWLAIRRRQWTADRRRRHGLDARDYCYLCDQEPECIDHIIVNCSYSRQVWTLAALALGIGPQPPPTGNILDWWTTWRSRWTGILAKGADTLFLLIAWELWKERNARCFRGASHSFK